MKKRVLSLLLALILLLSCVPQQVFAAKIAENLPAEEAAVLPSAEEPLSEAIPAQAQPEDRSSVQEEQLSALQPSAAQTVLAASDAELSVAEQEEGAGFAGGVGTWDDPYQIADYDDLLWFAKKVNSGTDYHGKCIQLTADIYINDISDYENWDKTVAPASYDNREHLPVIHGFAGIFDGGGHTLYGLYHSTYYMEENTLNGFVGLFGMLLSYSPVIICNLKLENAFIAGGDCGGLVGYACSVEVRNCSVSGKIMGRNAGGLMGFADVHNRISGFTKQNTFGFYFDNCANYAQVTATEFGGGLLGRGDLWQENKAGFNVRGVTIDCRNYGAVNSGYHGGGIAGYLFMTGKVSPSLYCDCINYGAVYGSSYAGGIFGEMSSTTSKNFSTLANYGSVSASLVAGGIFGCLGYTGDDSNSMTLRDSLNVGTVNGLAAETGGLVGRAGTSSVFTRCVNAGQTNGGAVFGGMSGRIEYVATSTGWVNMLMGRATVSDCYYLTGSGMQSYALLGMNLGKVLEWEICSTAKVKPLSSAEMADWRSFSGFDFFGVWQMGTVHPELRNSNTLWKTFDGYHPNADIVEMVRAYTQEEMYIQYYAIMYETVYDTPDDRHRALQNLFLHYGITDVNEGIDYLSYTTDRSRALNGLLTNDLYTASNYRSWLENTADGKFFRGIMFADGLVYNNEINDLLSFPTYVEEEYPGVKKYKAMLYDFMDAAAQEIEAQGYIKTLSDFAAKSTGNTRTALQDMIDQINEAETVDARRQIIKNSDLWENIGKNAVDADNFSYNEDGEFLFHYIFDVQSGFSEFAQAMDYAGTVINVADTCLNNFADLMLLESRLTAYAYFEEFLQYVIQDTSLPYQLRWAAEQITDEMEQGYLNVLYDFVMELLTCGTLNDAALNTIMSKLHIKGGIAAYLLTINITSFFVNNVIANIGEMVKDYAYVDGYAALADSFAGRLQDARYAFMDGQDEERAWDFYYIYTILYMLREKGEQAYIDLLQVEGIAGKLVENKHKPNIAAAERTLQLLREEYRFELTAQIKANVSPQYASKLVVACPVDVYVYDADGTQIALLKDGTASDVSNEYGRFAVVYDYTAEEYIKVACLLQEDCTVKIVAVDQGLVSAAVATADAEDATVYRFDNLAVEKGAVIGVAASAPAAGYTVDFEGDGAAESVESFREQPLFDPMPPVQSIALTPAALTMCAGNEETLHVRISPAEAGGKALSWISSDESVVSAANGRLTAKKAGAATVWVLTGDVDENGGSVWAECTVTVTEHSYTDGICTACGRQDTLLARGTCGENLVWTLNHEGLLTVSGTGAMQNWTSVSPAPWYGFRSSIRSVCIGEGVTGIGGFAFERCSSLTAVTIPKSVTVLGEYAFSDCSSLTSVVFRGDAPTVEDGAFWSVVATACYPAGNPTWTENVMQNYGGDITWVAYEAPPVGTISHNGWSVSVEDVIYLNEYLNITGFEGVDLATAGGMIVWTGTEKPTSDMLVVGGENCAVVEGMSYNEEFGGWYAQSLEVYAKDIDRTIYMRPYVEVAEGVYVYQEKGRAHSPAKFCGDLLNSMEGGVYTQPEEHRYVCAALLQYSALAQQFFEETSDYKPEKHVYDILATYENVNLSQYDLAFDADYLDPLVNPSSEKANSVTGIRKGVIYGKAVLSLQGAIRIDVGYSIDESVIDPEQVDWSKSGVMFWNKADYDAAQTLAYEEGNYTFWSPLKVADVQEAANVEGDYMASSHHILAKYLGETLYYNCRIVMKDGTVYRSGLGRFSPEAFVQDHVKGSDPNSTIVALCKSIAVYSEMARICFGEKAQ